MDEVNKGVVTSDGYYFALVPKTKDRREPFRLVSLHVSDVKKSQDYYTSVFGMNVYQRKDVNDFWFGPAENKEESVIVGYSADQALLELVELKDAKLDHAKALGRIATSCEEDGPWTVADKVKAQGAKIAHGPLALPPHGERVLVAQDHDGYDYCFVVASDYTKLCDKVKEKKIDWDFRAKKGGDGHPLPDYTREDESRDDEPPAKKSKKEEGEFRVTDIQSEEEYDKLIKSQSHVFVDFNATWCKPCKKILPEIKKWSVQDEFKHVLFLSVDVGTHDDLGDKLEIKQMPTFFFIFNGELMDRMHGINVDTILTRLKKLAAKKKE